MSGRDTSRRREAARRARDAKAAREKALALREACIEEALAAYYLAADLVERARGVGRVKADAALADAERVAAGPFGDACEAVRTLRDLCDNNAEVAELCGLRVEVVRDMLAAVARPDEALGLDESPRVAGGPGGESGDAGDG